VVSNRAGLRMPDANPGVTLAPSSAPRVLAILAVIGAALQSGAAWLAAGWDRECLMPTLASPWPRPLHHACLRFLLSLGVPRSQEQRG